MGKRIRVEKSDPPESKVVLAKAIIDIGEAVRKLNQSGLNKDAIIVLLKEKTKLGKGTIELVLDSLPQLESWYCK